MHVRVCGFKERVRRPSSVKDLGFGEVAPWKQPPNLNGSAPVRISGSSGLVTHTSTG